MSRWDVKGAGLSACSVELVEPHGIMLIGSAVERLVDVWELGGSADVAWGQ